MVNPKKETDDTEKVKHVGEELFKDGENGFYTSHAFEVKILSIVGDEAWVRHIPRDYCDKVVSLRDLYHTKDEALASLVKEWNCKALDLCDSLSNHIKFMVNHGFIPGDLRDKMRSIEGDIARALSGPHWKCDDCGHEEPKEAEVKCWKCGHGEMVYCPDPVLGDEILQRFDNEKWEKPRYDVEYFCREQKSGGIYTQMYKRGYSDLLLQCHAYGFDES